PSAGNRALELEDYERVDARRDLVRGRNTGRQLQPEEVGRRALEDHTSAFDRSLIRVAVAAPAHLGFAVDDGALRCVRHREDDGDRDAVTFHINELPGTLAVLATLYRHGDRPDARAVEIDHLLSRRGRT